MTVINSDAAKGAIKLQLDVEIFMITILIASDQHLQIRLAFLFKPFFLLLSFHGFLVHCLARAPSFSVSFLLYILRLLRFPCQVRNSIFFKNCKMRYHTQRFGNMEKCSQLHFSMGSVEWWVKSHSWLHVLDFVLDFADLKDSPDLVSRMKFGLVMAAIFFFCCCCCFDPDW